MVAQQPPPPPPSYPPPPPPPPAPGWQPAGTRPGGLSGAGILLIVLGGLRELFALIALVVVLAASDEFAGVDDAEVAIGIIVVALVIVIGVGLLQIFGGVNTLRLRRRGLVLGLTGSIIGIVLALLGLLSAGGTPAVTIVVNLLVLIGDVIAVILLAQNGRYLTQ
jgi:hypothetical protein